MSQIIVVGVIVLILLALAPVAVTTGKKLAKHFKKLG